jgi:hypothetical protein
MGIEPTAQAWEAWVLPLYDARAGADSNKICASRRIAGASADTTWVRPMMPEKYKHPFGITPPPGVLGVICTCHSVVADLLQCF